MISITNTFKGYFCLDDILIVGKCVEIESIVKLVVAV